MAADLVTATNLGPEFQIGSRVPGKITVRVDDTTITRAADGTLSAAPQPVTATLAPLYEYRDLWVEESAALGANQDEWSFGNGATGSIGLPFSAGWELVELGFQADSANANGNITVALVNYTPAVNQLATLTVDGVGQGEPGHAWEIEDLSAAPVAIPQGVIGFRTLARTGSYVDARISARFRRQVGQYVSAVTVT